MTDTAMYAIAYTGTTSTLDLLFLTGLLVLVAVATLVAILNRIGADVGATLDAEDPRVEVETIYEGLREFDEAWAQNGDSPVGCGCRRAYWSARIRQDAIGVVGIEHHCEWCGEVRTEDKR